MSLQRKLIRAEVGRILRGRTSAQDRVLMNRSEPVQSAGLALGKPVLRVYTMSEDVEVRSDTPRAYLRRLRVAIEGFVAESAQVTDSKGAPLPAEDYADDLAAQVEALLLCREGLPELKGRVSIDLAATAFEGVDTQDEWRGEQPQGAFRLTISYAYVTEHGEERLADLDPLKTVGVDWDLAPPDGELDAEDAIDLPVG